MIKYGRYIYGTLNECVDELYKLIDFDNRKFPEFDFAAWVDEDLTVDDFRETKYPADLGESWYGCKDISDLFDADTFNIVFGHYGGGGIVALEVVGDYEPEEKRDIIKCIKISTDELDEDSYTLFEIR